jgi:hypothetical protein
MNEFYGYSKKTKNWLLDNKQPRFNFKDYILKADLRAIYVKEYRKS